jgi:HK97 family phage portal protein
MSWWDRLLGRAPVAPAATEAASAATDAEAKGLTIVQEPGGFVTEVIGVGGTPAQRQDTAGLQQMQLRNELIFACIDTKATAAQDPRLVVERRVQRRGAPQWEEQAGHPMRALLMRPNPDMTEADLMRAAVVSWDVSNPRRFFCEKEYRGGLLVALHPLNPSKMEPILSRDRATTIGYAWVDAGQRREYSLDELLIRRAPAWYDPPPLVAAMGSAASDSAQTDYVWSFFANGGIPPGLLKYHVPLNDAKRDEIRERWMGVYGNRYGRQHSIGVLDSNADYQQTGAHLDQLSSQTLRSVAESRICMVFKVPPLIVYAYVGLLRATYANLRDAWSGFWDATMSPSFREWRAFWTWSLLSEFEEERDIRAEAVRLRYDMSGVAALQDDVDAAQARARANFQAGGISLGEYRSAIGAPPLAGADLLFRAQGLGPLGAGAAAAAPAEQPKGRKARTDAGVQVLERRLEADVAAYLERQYRRAADAAVA